MDDELADYESRDLFPLDIEWVMDLVEETGGEPFLICVNPPKSGRIEGQPPVFSLLLSDEGGVLMRVRPEDTSL